MNNNPYEPSNVITSEPETEEKKPESPQKLWSIGDVILIVGTCIFMFIAGLMLTGSLLASRDINHPDQAIQTINFTIAVTIVEFLVIIGSVYYLGIKRKQITWQDVGLRPLIGTGIALASGIGIVEFICETGATYVAQTVFHIPDVGQGNLFPTGTSWVSLVMLFAVGGLAIPFAEELLFRGVIYRFLSEHWGAWLGAIISAIIFALYYYVLSANLVEGIGGMVLGLFAALAYQKCKSLWGPVIVNLISSIGSFVILYGLSAQIQHLPIF